MASSQIAPLHPGSIDILRKGVVLFALAALVVLAIGWAVVAKYEQGRVEVISTQEQGYLRLAEQLIQRDYFEISGDLKFVAESPLLKHFLSQPTPDNLRRIQQTFLLMSREYARYDQIRYIDTTGHEIIRVNYNDGRPTVVPSQGLQDKADRPYFKQGVQLRRGEIYVSPMDLNIENKVIEKPYKPMVRVAAPVFDEQGTRRGVVVLNFLARKIQESLKQGIPSNTRHIPMVLNERGYWLSHPDKAKEFGFMFQDRGQTFEHDFPQEWQVISTQLNGVLQTPRGLFVYALVNPLSPRLQQDAILIAAAPTAGKMFLIMHVPAESLLTDSLFRRPVTAALLAFVLLVLAALAMAISYISVSNAQRLEQEHYISQKMEVQAHTDELTGIANRRYFTLLAEREVDRAARNRQPLSLLMLDIDLFKQINDRHGHAMGDQALQAFCRACEWVLRKTDVFGRIGGEEFAILMPDTNLETALAVSERVRDAVAQASVRGPDGKSLSFTVSIGVSSLDGGVQNLDELLRKADAALYRAKRAGRDRVVAESLPTASS